MAKKQTPTLDKLLDPQKMSREERIEYLWDKWNKTKDPDVMDEIVDNFEGYIKYLKSVYRNSGIPESAIEGEGKRLVVEAVKKYKPGGKAKLGTYVSQWGQKMFRFVSKYQNIGRIPESRVAKINTYKTAVGDFYETYGREPTTEELSDELSWSPKEIERMRRELRGDVSFGQPESQSQLKDMSVYDPDLITFFHSDLPQIDQKIMEHLTGFGGVKKLTVDETAKKLKLPKWKVAYAKKKLSKKLREYLSLFQSKGDVDYTETIPEDKEDFSLIQ